jgi:hypothetical protein
MSSDVIKEVSQFCLTMLKSYGLQDVAIIGRCANGGDILTNMSIKSDAEAIKIFTTVLQQAPIKVRLQIIATLLASCGADVHLVELSNISKKGGN